MKPDGDGVPIPGLHLEGEPPGKLIVLEGTDGVGRSTQTQLLRNWLEASGLAVHDTGLTRSRLAGRHIQEAKEGHTMGPCTQALFYATDFADRLEDEIVPALRAGYVVLTDRYIHSLMARAAVRGMDRAWLRKLYGFAVKPDLILYLKVSMHKLIPRVLAGGGFDYWESGMDYLRQDNMYESFVEYQTALLKEFDQMTPEFGFTVVDADRSIRGVFDDVQSHVEEVVADMIRGEQAPTEFVVPTVPAREPLEERRSMSEALREFFSSLIEDT